MNLKTIIIILSLFCFSAISQNIKQDSCQLFFKEIGVKDFILGSNYSQFIKDSKSFKRKFNKESVYGIDVVTFNENIILLKEKKTVQYNLKFHSDTLMDYSFRIKAGNFRLATYYYQKVLKLLEKNNKNSFINKGGYSFMKTTKECQKNFNLEQEEGQYYISGGISYESPIWEQQFKDYMKATGQDKE
ncbi:hypothetical protein ACHRV1_07775 [Flavobacterium aquidurense]|uniref:hypothetical protein n=1 Tax=Flavobacterium aquidurense TaxID=362413 RepID=UPI003756FF5F